MNFEHIKATARSLRAVMGADGNGVYFRNKATGSVFIDSQGNAVPISSSLEDVLAGSPLRTGVYDGDTIRFVCD